MFQTFPKFRKPEDSTDRQFPCLRNDMETSTQVSQLSYMWDPKGIMTLIDSVCGNDWETTIVVSKNMGNLSETTDITIPIGFQGVSIFGKPDFSSSEYNPDICIFAG